ncbi:sodium:solute symporter family protein [Desulfuromonas sp. AOP6]|uniref:sodium:solute symporter family protein n=1 Tax=Desulfuromonas sp. AOP6 TaxID=1566351 RepID=UPI00126E94E8|nr:sodium:solute symporter family protein [Desulfuromonas sp. AOP6]BCA80728.1 sodium:solute symporter [Desulfuromonas sp. AOP6]
MTPTLPFLVTFATTLVAMTLFSAVGRRQVRSAQDFSVAGRQAGRWSVAGAIMGTLVGGASTIGTVQLAFLYGLSAWWFTLGAGLACLFLGLFMAAPLRRGEVETIPQFISRFYGPRPRLAASLFSAAGMFVHIVAQLLACSAILTSLFGLSLFQGALLSAGLVAVLSLQQGMLGAGRSGLLKLLLLYITMVSAGLIAFTQSGGWQGLAGSFAPFPWFSLFGYGIGAGLNDLLSMLVGVVSTQTYLQAIFSARDAKAARQGALLSAVLIPPLGLFGIAVGLFMRQSQPGLDSALALPTFLFQQLPPLFAGIAFAALLIAALGTAAGLTLGVGTTLQVDVISRFAWTRKHELASLRLITLAALLLALLLVLVNLGSTIMAWSFLSMGLRGATLCLPLLAALFLREHLSPRGGALAIYLGPTVVLVAGFIQTNIPPLYLGLAAAFFALACGQRRPRGKSTP